MYSFWSHSESNIRVHFFFLAVTPSLSGVPICHGERNQRGGLPQEEFPWDAWVHEKIQRPGNARRHTSSQVRQLVVTVIWYSGGWIGVACPRKVKMLSTTNPPVCIQISSSSSSSSPAIAVIISCFDIQLASPWSKAEPSERRQMNTRPELCRTQFEMDETRFCSFFFLSY